MLHILKHYRIDHTRPGYRPINFDLIRVLLSLLLMLLLIPASAAPTTGLLKGIMQESSSKPAPGQSEINPAALIGEIRTKLAETREKLALVPTDETARSSSPEADAGGDRIKRRLRLRQLVYIYQGQLARLADLQMIQKNRIELERKTADWSGFSEPSAHPFLRADELHESVLTLDRRLGEFDSWNVVLEQAGEFLISIVQASTVKLRQADEAVEQAKESPDEQARLSQERDQLALQNQINMARAAGLQIERQMTQEAFLETRAKLQLARKRLGVASEHVELTQQDIEQVHKNLETESQAIIAEIRQAASTFDLENKANPREKLESGSAGVAAQPQSAGLEQSEPIRRARLKNADIRLLALNRILGYLDMQRDIWDLRWVYAKVTEREKVTEAYAQIARNQKLLQVIHEYINQYRQRTMASVTDQVIDNIDQSVTGLDALGKAPDDLDQVVSYSRLMGIIESTQNLLERGKQELDKKFVVKSFPDYLEEGLLTARDIASQIWEFELFAVQDNIEVDGKIISGKRSITVDKVVTALAILIVGYWFAARLARLFEGLAVTRLGMDESLARIARRWILFLEVLLLVVLSMLVVKIPLTIFAFMGGALAIGAGFGMQNLLKNLISGIMLLFERPFRPGDVVEVGGIRGRIMDIGVRSSHILDANGIETLIPNSTFIEQNVTNWTLSSKSVRIVVNVGIAYGSPVKEVSRMLIEVADRHGLVLKDPAPQVLFEDFGSDALLFGLYVWVIINPDISWKTIASDLRYMISKTLAENGIAIAFPQRDIHLDTSRPLEVRVLADAADTGTVKG